MNPPLFCLCYRCQAKLEAPIKEVCPSCGFSLDHLVGKRLSDFQFENWEKHTDLLRGRDIDLYGGVFNASFDNYGDSSIEDLVRYTLSYGHRSKLPSRGGRHQNDVAVAFIPNIIGSGVSIYNQSGPAPCSGVCIISPVSQTYGHPFPVLDDWLHATFPKEVGGCASCGAATPFGHSICSRCYAARGGDWRKWL